MNFLSPFSLLLFGLAVPIVLLYILKLRRRREPVSTLMFWDELFREKQTTSLFQRLKHLLSLLLQLLFLILLVLAIARPQFAFITKSARQIILIIDHSASMNVVTDTAGTSRLTAAKERALHMVDGLRFIDEIMVMSCHTRPIIHSPFTSHQQSLRQAIESIQPTDISTDLEPALDLAYAVAQTKPNPEIAILSDFQSVSEKLIARFQNPHETVKLHLLQTGEAGDNVGITQFRVRKSLANVFDYQALLTVVNTSAIEKQFNVELYFNEDLFDVRPYTLAPGESTSEIFNNFAFEGGKLKAVLDITDALHSDNVAYATLPKREQTSVLLVTTENPFLEKALSVDAKLNLTIIAPEAYSLQSQNPYEVIIFDRYSPPVLGAGNYMFIYPPSSSEASDAVDSNPATIWEIGPQLEMPIITDWERTHPILRHVHLEYVQIGEAYQVTPPATAQVLASSFDNPVLFTDTTSDRKIVFAALNILESDLPLRIAFPLIIANTIEWFQQDSGIQEYHLHTGEVLKHVPKEFVENSTENIRVTGPGNRTWEIPVKQSGALFDQTQIAGFYELTLTNRPLPELTATTNAENADSETVAATEVDNGIPWAVNLTNEMESHINTDPAIAAYFAESVSPNSPALGRYPPWVYLLLIAIGLSAAEWFLYQRRRID